MSDLHQARPLLVVQRSTEGEGYPNVRPLSPRLARPLGGKPELLGGVFTMGKVRRHLLQRPLLPIGVHAHGHDGARREPPQ